MGCLTIHGAHVTANNFTNNNAAFLFCFRFENSILKQQLFFTMP